MKRLYPDEYDDDATYYDVVTMFNWMHHHGLLTKYSTYLGPHYAHNDEVARIMRRMRTINAYPRYSGIPAIDIDVLAPFTSIPTYLQNVVNYNRPGIAILQFYTATDSDRENFNNFLDWLEDNNFVVLDWFWFFDRCWWLDLNLTLIPSQRKETLTDNITTEVGEDTLILDPNGANRNITPSGYFPRGYQLTIINTADAAENLVFDPSGLNLTIGQNQRAIVVYDGSQWLKVYLGS